MAAPKIRVTDTVPTPPDPASTASQTITYRFGYSPSEVKISIGDRVVVRYWYDHVKRYKEGVVIGTAEGGYYKVKIGWSGADWHERTNLKKIVGLI